MSPQERKDAERLGLGRAVVGRHGNAAASGDAADSNWARTSETVTDYRYDRALLAEILASNNRGLAAECLALVFNLRPYTGESMSAIGRKYGITRAAVSKRCVVLAKKLNVQHCRAMRSSAARNTYQKSAKEHHDKLRSKLYGQHDQ